MHLGEMELQSGVLHEMEIPDGFRMAGWVYILSNECMPDIYKIGMTTNSPEARAKELSSATGVPIPFKVEATFHCDDPARSEREIHEALHEFRVNDSREFFRDNLEDLIGTCEQFCQANASSSVEMIADSYDVICFESLGSLNVAELFEDIGLDVFGNQLATAERLIRIGAHYLNKSLFKNDCSVVFSQGKVFAIEGSEAQSFREMEEEQRDYYQQLEAAGIYGPNKPVEV